MKKELVVVIILAVFFLCISCDSSGGEPEDTSEPSIPHSETHTLVVCNNDPVSGEMLTADKTVAKAGETVILTASLGTGRQVVVQTDQSDQLVFVISENTDLVSFTMPDADSTIHATFCSIPAVPAGHSVNTIINGVEFAMKFVPAGARILLGETMVSAIVPGDVPTKPVIVTRHFWMSETEVTQELWESTYGAWPFHEPHAGYGLGPEYPAYFVNWYDTAAFCNLLTIDDSLIGAFECVYYSDPGFTALYSSDDANNERELYVDWARTGYRMPTEAEWEYAARYLDRGRFNHGNHVSGDTGYCIDECLGCSHPEATVERISLYAWWSGSNTPNGSKPVGLKTGNALGIKDMSGNVYEWCHDYYVLGYGGEDVNSSGPETGTVRVHRGGMWLSPDSTLRCAARAYAGAYVRSGDNGIRLCRTTQ